MDIFECCQGRQSSEEEPECLVSGRMFESEALMVDHLTSTPLFDAILQEDWSGVDFLLRPDFFPPQLQLHIPQPFEEGVFEGGKTLSIKEQLETWVVCNDEEGTYLWRQLPIHAAICYGAPLKTIEGLLRAFPDGLCAADTNGNLPLHLAIEFNSTRDVFLCIMKAFPEAIHAKNGDKKTPLDCISTKTTTEAAQTRINLLQTFMECQKVLISRENETKQEELKQLKASARRAEKALAKATVENIGAKTEAAQAKRKFGFTGSWRFGSKRVLPTGQ